MGGKVAAAILGLSMAVGLAGAGYFISTTVYKGRLASNTVTVKGFAERDVRADLALWQISYSITGGKLDDVYARSHANEETLVAFLVQKGFRGEDIKPGNLNLTDLQANPYRPKDASDRARYILNENISVRSNDVDLVERTMRELNDLIKQGIVLIVNNADYQFTKLNDIKTPMLREATQNARDAAQQFANDAGSKVGSIQSANQGFFSIVSRDAVAQTADSDPGFAYQQGMVSRSAIDKKVRVVATLTYYLER